MPRQYSYCKFYNFVNPKTAYKKLHKSMCKSQIFPKTQITTVFAIQPIVFHFLPEKYSPKPNTCKYQKLCFLHISLIPENFFLTDTNTKQTFHSFITSNRKPQPKIYTKTR